MPGVTVGHGSIIASKSVVTKDVPPYAIVAGNPARVVGARFDEATTKLLLSIAWWDWPTDQVTENIRAIMAGDARTLEAVANT